MLKRILPIAVIVAIHASTAAAQQPPGRVVISAPVSSQHGYLDVNLGLQPSTTSFDVTIHPLTFVEPATVETKYSVNAAKEFEIGGGAYVTHSLAVGASLSRLKKSDDSPVSAQVPHPFFFNRPRAVSGTAAGLTRTETAVHMKLLWIASAGGFQAVLSGGPTYFKIKQDLVDDIRISQSYPYDTATFDSAVVTNHAASGLGFNAGLDLIYLVTPHMGVGVAAGISRASLELGTPPDNSLSVDAGGLRIGGGLRFRF
jgi:hypothetical protein